MKPAIAIITDDILFNNLFSPLLIKKFPDLEVHMCKSYYEIDKELEETFFDLIIVDGGISNISCIEIIQYLRMTKQVIIPIWFFPEIRTEEYFHKSRSIGVNKIIKKPFDPYLVTAEITDLFLKKQS